MGDLRSCSLSIAVIRTPPAALKDCCPYSVISFKGTGPFLGGFGVGLFVCFCFVFVRKAYEEDCGGLYLRISRVEFRTSLTFRSGCIPVNLRVPCSLF